MPRVYGAKLEEVIRALAQITRDCTYERLGQEVEQLKGQSALQ